MRRPTRTHSHCYIDGGEKPRHTAADPPAHPSKSTRITCWSLLCSTRPGKDHWPVTLRALRAHRQELIDRLIDEHGFLDEPNPAVFVRQVGVDFVAHRRASFVRLVGLGAGRGLADPSMNQMDRVLVEPAPCQTGPANITSDLSRFPGVPGIAGTSRARRERGRHSRPLQRCRQSRATLASHSRRHRNQSG